MTTTWPGLMMPAFSRAISSIVEPSHFVWSQGDRRDDGDARVNDVRGVPASAHADLDDGGVDRVVGEGRVRHDCEHLEEGQTGAALLRAALVHHADVGLDVLPCAHEALARDRVAPPARCVRARRACEGS